MKEISADADADDNDDESIVSPLRVRDTIMEEKYMQSKTEVKYFQTDMLN